MSDLLRICLFIFLSLGIVASPIVYSIEIFLEYFHFDRFLFAIGLSLTQLILLVVVLKTKHFRTIVFVLIFVTSSNRKFSKLKKIFFSVVSLILFFIELRYFQNYLRIHREDFYRLIFNYPKGNKPNEKRLIDHFLVVQEKKCCGVTRNYLLAFEEQEYFHYFPDNCVSLYDPRPRQTFRYK